MVKQKNLILPKTDDIGRPYLSYSQLSTWKRSKREYIRQYFLGESFEGSAYTEFGSKVGEALENGDFSDFTEKEQEFLETIPRYDEFEREVKLQMDGFYIIGFIDTNTKVKDYKNGKGGHIRRIADYKTGDVVKKKADYESDAYTQLEIYSAALQQQFGELPDDACVYLIDRKGNAFRGEQLTLGNEFITITRDISQDRIDFVLDDIQKTAEEISEYYQVFLKLNKLI